MDKLKAISAKVGILPTDTQEIIKEKMLTYFTEKCFKGTVDYYNSLEDKRKEGFLVNYLFKRLCPDEYQKIQNDYNHKKIIEYNSKLNYIKNTYEYLNACLKDNDCEILNYLIKNYFDEIHKIEYTCLENYRYSQGKFYIRIFHKPKYTNLDIYASIKFRISVLTKTVKVKRYNAATAKYEDFVELPLSNYVSDDNTKKIKDAFTKLFTNKGIKQIETVQVYDKDEFPGCKFDIEPEEVFYKDIDIDTVYNYIEHNYSFYFCSEYMYMVKVNDHTYIEYLPKAQTPQFTVFSHFATLSKSKKKRSLIQKGEKNY